MANNSYDTRHKDMDIKQDNILIANMNPGQLVTYMKLLTEIEEYDDEALNLIINFNLDQAFTELVKIVGINSAICGLINSK